MSARDDVLARVRAAVSGSAPVVVPREYRTAKSEGSAGPAAADVIELLVDRLVDYKATVHRSDASGLGAALSLVLGSDKSVALPPGVPPEWLEACAAAGVRIHVDGGPDLLTAAELDDTDAVVTGCRVAIAATGTIVLDAGPDQGRRVLTLVPDHHVVIVFAEQVVDGVPESLNRLDPTRPLTFISGPSATSDIEFKRVEGVHGPRVLDVIVVG